MPRPNQSVEKILAFFVKNHGVWIYIKRLVAELNYTELTVRRALTYLESENVITVDRSSKKHLYKYTKP